MPPLDGAGEGEVSRREGVDDASRERTRAAYSLISFVRRVLWRSISAPDSPVRLGLAELPLLLRERGAEDDAVVVAVLLALLRRPKSGNLSKAALRTLPRPARLRILGRSRLLPRSCVACRTSSSVMTTVSDCLRSVSDSHASGEVKLRRTQGCFWGRTVRSSRIFAVEEVCSL